MVEIHLTFLGTGGSVPSLSRSLPSVALKRGREILLFDCGEGTQYQLVRTGLSPLKINAVFITHLHGDHFLGLAGIVQTMSLLDRSEPLEVYVPKGEGERIKTFLRIPRYTPAFTIEVKELEPGEEVRREGYRILTSRAEHGVKCISFGFLEDPRPGRLDPSKAVKLGVKPGPDFSALKSGRPVELPNGRVVEPGEVVGPPRPGRKIVYAVDTRPCEAVVRLSKGADLLIHDSSLADELVERAKESGHSTPSEAAMVAKRAGVKLLVLTHISSRYRDASILLEQARKIFPNTMLAEDLMRLEVPLRGSETG